MTMTRDPGDERRDKATSGPTPAADASTRSANAWEDIRKLDLVEHVAELEATGLTVVEPEKVAAPGFALRLRDAILRVGEQRSGSRIDLDDAREPGEGSFGDVFGLQLY